MVNLLKELELEELSLVDVPANPQAFATLFKRDNGDNMEMSEEMDEKVKAYMKEKGCDRKTAEEALIKAYDEHETLKAENERLRKGLIENGFVIKADAIEKKVEEEIEYIEVEGEKIAKSDVPAPILKQLEAAEESLKVAKAKEEDQALEKRAEEKLPHFKKEVAKKLLGAVEKMEEIDMLMEALEAADKAFADKMEELGKSDIDGDFDTAEDKMDALVKAHMKEQKLTKKDYYRAYAEVSKTDEGKAVLKAIRKGE